MLFIQSTLAVYFSVSVFSSANSFIFYHRQLTVNRLCVNSEDRFISLVSMTGRSDYFGRKRKHTILPTAG